MTGASWGRRAGLAGIAAGALAAGAALGVAAERQTVGRWLHREPPRPAPVPGTEPAGPPPAPGAVEEHVVFASDGVLLHAEVEPAADPRTDTGLTIVLCHGYALALESWRYQRADLAHLGRVVLYDQRGHGRSARGDRDRSTIDQLGSDLARVLDTLAPEGPLVLVGHSMGGMTIMALADQQPRLFGDRIVGVALCSTSPGAMAEVTLGIPVRGGRVLRRVAPPVFDQLARRPQLVARSRRVASDLELALTRRYSFASDVPPHLVEQASDMVSRTSLETIADFWTAFDAHDKLAALPVLSRVETLVLGGEGDLITPADHSRQIAEAVPDAELVIVPAAGHLVQMEHPETVNAHLRSLVERAAARAGRSR